MSEEGGQLIRFPIERRRAEAYDAEQYVELVHGEGLRVEGMCNKEAGWHVYSFGAATCFCGEAHREPAS